MVESQSPDPFAILYHPSRATLFHGRYGTGRSFLIANRFAILRIRSLSAFRAIARIDFVRIDVSGLDITHPSTYSRQTKFNIKRKTVRNKIGPCAVTAYTYDGALATI